MCRPVLRAWFNSRYKMSYPEVPDLPAHFLLISNHVTNADPFLIAATLGRHVYFVATEHLFRLGFRSRLIRFLQDPIPITKGGSTSGAVLEILRRLREGKSICLFAFFCNLLNFHYVYSNLCLQRWPFLWKAIF